MKHLAVALILVAALVSNGCGESHHGASKGKTVIHGVASAVPQNHAKELIDAYVRVEDKKARWKTLDDLRAESAVLDPQIVAEFDALEAALLRLPRLAELAMGLEGETEKNRLDRLRRLVTRLEETSTDVKGSYEWLVWWNENKIPIPRPGAPR